MLATERSHVLFFNLEGERPNQCASTLIFKAIVSKIHPLKCENKPAQFFLKKS